MYKNAFIFSSLNDHVESNAWSSKYQQAFDFITSRTTSNQNEGTLPKNWRKRDEQQHIFERGNENSPWLQWAWTINLPRLLVMLHIVASRVSRYHHFWTWFMIIIYNCILFIAVAKDVSGNERKIDKINKEKETSWTHHFSIIKYLIFNIVFGYF